MPKLNALCFRPEANVEKLMVDHKLIDFFSKHGFKLASLDFGGNQYWRHDTAVVETLLLVVDLCNSLEHLVLRVSSAETIQLLKGSSLFLKSLKHVDLVVQGVLFSSTQQPYGQPCHRGAAWENIRYLDIDLLCRVPDLPYIFTDFEGRERAPHIEDYFGLKIKEVSTT